MRFLHTHKYKLIFLCVALISLTLTYFLCSLPSASEYETDVFQNKSVQTVITEEKTDENNASENEILHTATPEEVCITTATPSPAASTSPAPIILPTPSPTAEPIPSQEAVADETPAEIIDVVIASPMPEISPSPVLPTPIPDTKTDKPDEAAPAATQLSSPQTTSSEKAISQEKKTEETSQTEDLTCTLSIRCDTILDNTKKLNENIVSILPPDGIILKEQEVIISEDDSVFDVLMRETKKHKIHLEHVSVPIQGGTYIEGIYNIYEFDCGELSGWMYKVNGEFPQISSSDYTISAGDKIEWVYTCDLGKDVGKIIKETDKNYEKK